MAVYRSVHLSFWTDNKIEDDFTSEDKFFYLYLLTNPATNICGCYEISFKNFCGHTGYTKEKILEMIKKFQDKYKMIAYNEDTKEILILKWYRYNWSKSEKTLVGVESVAQYIKCERFRKYIFAIVDDIRKDNPKVDTADKGHKRPNTKNKFNNFQQREYDMEKLEKYLINKQ